MLYNTVFITTSPEFLQNKSGLRFEIRNFLNFLLKLSDKNSNDFGKEYYHTNNHAGESHQKNRSRRYILYNFNVGMALRTYMIAQLLNGCVKSFGHEHSSNAENDSAPFPIFQTETKSHHNYRYGRSKMKLCIVLMSEKPLDAGPRIAERPPSSTHKSCPRWKSAYVLFLVRR